MKRSIIAAAILLLLLSSTTYATPRRANRRAPRVRFWSSVLCWFGHNHHDGCGHYAPRQEYGHMPPGHRGRWQHGRGWHSGWERGRHNGWDRRDDGRGWDPDRGERRDGERGEREHGRGGGHGRG